MFFSKSKDESVSAATSASTSSASTSSAAPAPAPAPAHALPTAPASSSYNEAEWQTKGAAGLGAISSMSPECTPLKHRYDSCFNLWFKDYLAIGDGQIREQQRQSEASSSGTASPASESSADKKKSGWFSDSSSSWSVSTSAASSAESDLETRKRAIMERYDQDCGKLFKDYQACKAVTERGLEDLIRQARKENPFPFDHQRQSDPRANNPPFPFPVARD
ncbi:uncharacterized protein UBRO_08878 [Ustilago bromivora]|uniref:Uncharacterized protein n=1 Tax=Ustilago bromivora TaxID=307758 RepID=A0A1K0HMP5_9BASI|nr:uncharacterized protein UBRO_08878 [Ustilago bromivora]SYW77498.1 uncharacterized protein UBRO2_01878 [Ustilago bromivora]